MGDDPYRALAEAFALGALDGEELAGFRDHLAACPDCSAEVAAQGEILRRLAGEGGPAPDPGLRDHVLEMAEAPIPPVDLQAYAWDEPVPGIRLHTLKEDPVRGIRAVLVWAKPGARYPSHRHLGDEEILVLQGRMRDHRGVYGPGDICRSRTGFVHSEEVVGADDCVCYVVYHGGHEAVPE